MTSLTHGISHVGLTLRDINKSARFFEAIGFSQIGGQPEYPSIFMSDGVTLLTLWQTKHASPEPFDRTRNAGLHHLAIKVPTLEALDRLFEIVQKYEGATVEFDVRPIEGMGLTHFMCNEPGGVRVEFTHHAA